MDSVETLIASIGGRVTSRSYRYLEEAVRRGLDALGRGGFPRHQLAGTIYAPVAKTFGVDAGTTSRAIARAAKDCWDNGNRPRLLELIGRKQIDRPSPGELIYYLSCYLYRREEQRQAPAETGAESPPPLSVPVQTYYMFRKEHYAPDMGVYHSYDIVAYGDFFRGPVQVVPDVTPSFEVAYHMIEFFNRFDLSPIHLMDAILNLLP